MYSKNQKKRHVALLQNALQTLGYAVHPDGIYGETTTAAVRRFQQDHALPPTGQADSETWKKVMALSQLERHTGRPPEPIRLPRSAFPTREGLPVGMAQLALDQLSRLYPNIRPVPVTSRYDEQTHRQLDTIRKVWNLPPSDTLDAPTYHALIHLLNSCLAQHG